MLPNEKNAKSAQRMGMIKDTRIQVNTTFSTYWHSLYALVNGLDVDDGEREITD